MQLSKKYSRDHTIFFIYLSISLQDAACVNFLKKFCVLETMFPVTIPVKITKCHCTLTPLSNYKIFSKQSNFSKQVNPFRYFGFIKVGFVSGSDNLLETKRSFTPLPYIQTASAIDVDIIMNNCFIIFCF